MSVSRGDDSLILAIDQGTTGTTILMIDRSGSVVARGYREISCQYPQPGWVEQDAEEIWRRSLEAMADALCQCPGRPVAAIGIANQRETTVLWDAATSRPVAPVIVWQCRRTTPLCDDLRARGLSDEIRQRTGLVIDPYFSATKIRWLLDNDPGLAARARRGEIRFGTIDSWLIWKLSNGTVHRTDWSNASRTMLYNIYEHRWDASLLDILGVPHEILPEVCRSSYPFAATSEIQLPDRAALAAGIPITGVAGDQQAALFGQTCFAPGTMKCTYGTGAFLLVNTGAEPIRSRFGLVTTLASGVEAALAYALEGSIFIAGAAVQWLRDELGIVERASDTDAVARQVPDNAGVYFVPAFVGLGAPHWDSQARGALVGLTRGVGRPHLVRAALEAIAYQTRDVVEAVIADAGPSDGALRIDGGAAANDFLAQFQADILGTPVVRPRITETTAIGVAFLAGLAIGFWKSTEELSRLWQVDRHFEPAISDDQRDALYQGWKKAVASARTYE